MKTEPCKKAMESGDFMCALQETEVDRAREEELAIANQMILQEMQRFAPNLFIISPLIAWLGDICEKAHIPYFHVFLQPHCIPSNDYVPIMLARAQLQPEQPKLSMWTQMTMNMARAKLFEEIGIEAALPPGLSMKDLITQAHFQPAEAYFDSQFRIEEGAYCLNIGAFSAAFWPPPKDWPTANVEVVGNIRLSAKDQVEYCQKGSTYFSVGSEHQSCVDFLAAGSPPVYIGWGSMRVHTPEYMTRLAVGALKAAGQRGLIISGWAGLSIRCLEAEEDSELREYCRENVLFVKAAPHEWLFPQCACAVHHGGIGTTQASLAAGTPTVVTPCFADQHDIAELMTARKTGAGTCLLSKVTVEELGGKIRKCCEDKEIIATAKKLGEDMQKETGLQHLLDIITTFMRDEWETGNWMSSHVQKYAKLWERREKRKKRTPEALVAGWNAELMSKYPVLKAWFAKQQEQATQLSMLIQEKTLKLVTSPSLLAREAVGLKSAEVGRFAELAIVEVLAQEGNRYHVKRREGNGPEKGWISAVISGKETVRAVGSLQELNLLQSLALQEMFADVSGAMGAKGIADTRAMLGLKVETKES
eukprot:gnl/TRDRNA2_/TRDRNA2_169076_c0_seq2.p1 gnl/TRDRNA2_/TRDRNA2_169076_c0~~gnl/TRDRNA2_/TRDRNA2_169076_c0_seq2.p1  ORF type:complete len:590 (+),score=102.40 gnl/TRDRNA2_/TRDRNA2_169076_c0_seq2:37-1806(+)